MLTIIAIWLLCGVFTFSVIFGCMLGKYGTAAFRVEGLFVLLTCLFVGPLGVPSTLFGKVSDILDEE